MVPVWMTFSDLFKIMIIQRQITWKWYSIQLCLQWPTNRKSYIMIYRTAPFSMTIERPLPQFQGHTIFWRWIFQKRYNIQTWCHWNTNRDLHTLYATVSFRITLSDLEWLSKIFKDTKRRAACLARPVCDSWASCYENVVQQNFVLPNLTQKWYGSCHVVVPMVPPMSVYGSSVDIASKLNNGGLWGCRYQVSDR